MNQVCLFKFIKQIKDKIRRIIKKMNALVIEISPLAKGLCIVLDIFLSISLSHKSFIMQPADLIKNAPAVKMKNKNSTFKKGKFESGKVHKQGSKSNHVPIDLSNLASLIHTWVFFGK